VDPLLDITRPDEEVLAEAHRRFFGEDAIQRMLHMREYNRLRAERCPARFVVKIAPPRPGTISPTIQALRPGHRCGR
jgi:hypothetical protein